MELWGKDRPGSSPGCEVLGKLLALSEPHLYNENIHVYLKGCGRGVRFNDVCHGHIAHGTLNKYERGPFLFQFPHLSSRPDGLAFTPFGVTLSRGLNHMPRQSSFTKNVKWSMDTKHTPAPRLQISYCTLNLIY